MLIFVKHYYDEYYEIFVEGEMIGNNMLISEEGIDKKEVMKKREFDESQLEDFYQYLKKKNYTNQERLEIYKYALDYLKAKNKNNGDLYEKNK